MGEDYEEVAPLQQSKPQGRHIKKRALKNKALSVSFNEKDLRDYVTGFHKRKKKRRKEAQKKQEEAERRKRIERRKKRKLEKEFVLYGGALPSTGSGPEESHENNEEDKEGEQTATVSGIFLILQAARFTCYYNSSLRKMIYMLFYCSYCTVVFFYDTSPNLLSILLFVVGFCFLVEGTTLYDSGNMTVTVTTSEISRKEEEDLTSEKTHKAMLKSVGDGVDRKHKLLVSKSKPFKKVAKHSSRPPSKRDRNKAKKRDKKML
ncbi:hypothetical protein REPUB_Repub14bG0133200 [Reevesia pubescens]